VLAAQTSRRILIVSSYFPPHVGGVEVVVQHQANALALAGHRVVVATTRTDRSAPAREDVGGYVVRRLPASNVIEDRSRVPYPLVSPTFCQVLWRLVRSADLVHVHDVIYQPPQIAALFAHVLRRPLCVTQHTGPATHENRLVVAGARLSSLVAGRFIWRRAARVCAHNQLIYDHLRHHGVRTERIVRTENGVDTTAFAPGPVTDESGLRARLGLPANRPLVLFVGRLVRQKGFERLIAAAGDEYHIVLVGPGEPPDRLPATVTCTGSVRHDDLAQLYRMADVFALPAVGEVFPLVVQEAMACGLPVVTTDDPRYDTFGMDRRLVQLVSPDPAALRRAILAITSAPELRQRMSEYSRRFALERFDWRLNQTVLLQMYDGVIAERAGREPAFR
jgi:D-inositol-3-phosphate glycosyltransferase